VPLDIAAGQQVNLRIVPDATRRYEVRTVGVSDTVMVLFQDVNGELRYRTVDEVHAAGAAVLRLRRGRDRRRHVVEDTRTLASRACKLTIAGPRTSVLQ